MPIGGAALCPVPPPALLPARWPISLGIKWFCLQLLQWEGSSAWACPPAGRGFALNPPRSPGLEQNGMTGMDMAEVPPPLPLKGSMADYGNLMDSQDLLGSPPPPPPPPHHRVSRRRPWRCQCLCSTAAMLPPPVGVWPRAWPGLDLGKGHGDRDPGLGHLWTCHGDTRPEVALEQGKGQDGHSPEVQSS